MYGLCRVKTRCGWKSTQQLGALPPTATGVSECLGFCHLNLLSWIGDKALQTITQLPSWDIVKSFTRHRAERMERTGTA